MKTRQVSILERKMQKLADETELDFDGGDDDHLFVRDERISVFAQLMDQETYDRMETEMENATIKRKNYSVYAWNDCSGFEYWHDQSEGESNYIQVTVAIKETANISKIDIEQLKEDVADVHYSLSRWDNTDEYYA